MKRNNKREIKTIVKEISGDTKSLSSFAIAAIAVAGAVLVGSSQVPFDETSAVTCTDGACNTTFQVNVQDSLTVSVTPTTSNATGNINTFLRDQVNLSVSSNVSNGFTASMYSSSDNTSSTKTDLAHTSLGASYVIPTLTSGTVRSSFPSDSWGYSLKTSPNSTTYGETDAGNNSSYYYPLTASTSSPITILSASAGTQSGTQSIYFGAKASSAKPSGTYRNTVVISVVTGTIDSSTNPITPTNPVTPSTDVANDSAATYTGSTGTGATQGVGASGTTGTTVYTTTSTSGSVTTTTTNVSGGDNRNVSPLGVSTISETTTYTSGVTQGNSVLPVALAATAGVAATAGTFFFILAKKRDDDDDEEEEV